MAQARAAILTVSDSRSAGQADDRATPVLRELLAGAAIDVVEEQLVADDRADIVAALERMCDSGEVDLVVTSGGTGLGPRDVTPEATQAVVEREIPGIGEAFRARGAQATPYAWLSRGTAGQRGATLIVNLPGSPKAVAECMEVLTPLVSHAIDVVRGANHG